MSSSSAKNIARDRTLALAQGKRSLANAKAEAAAAAAAAAEAEEVLLFRFPRLFDAARATSATAASATAPAASALACSAAACAAGIPQNRAQSESLLSGEEVTVCIRSG